MPAKKSFQMNSKSHHKGFTLIEVLVAMAIVAIGMTAVFMQVNQIFSSSIYLQQKTLATWIAADKITEVRLLNESSEPKTIEDQIEMANTDWFYRVVISKAPGPLEDLRRIDAYVYLADDLDTVIGSATGFRGGFIERNNPIVPGTRVQEDNRGSL